MYFDPEKYTLKSNVYIFAMGTILGKGFAQAQVHTNHSTSAKGTSALMYALLLVIFILQDRLGNKQGNSLKEMGCSVSR